MKKTISLFLGALLVSVSIGACGGGGGSGFTPPPPPPPPPPAGDQSPTGLWSGTAVTPDITPVSTGFENVGAGTFTVGPVPFTATFAGGVAESRAVPGLYRDGINSWHVLGAATINFATPANTLSFWTRTVSNGDMATIVVRDTGGGVIDTIIPPDMIITEFTINSAGGPLIGSVDITVTTGEIVIDVVTFGFPSIASTDAIACLIAPNDLMPPNNEFVCVIVDATTDALVAGANGTVSVAVDQISGTGWLYAASGESFADGSTIAAITISAGTVDENTSLTLTIDGTGVSIDVDLPVFAPSINRGSALANVEAAWINFEIFGDPSTFDVDAMGMISGISAAGCLLMGQVTVTDSAVNAYDVAITVTDGGGGTCGIPAGDYNGLGATDEETVPDDEFGFAVFVNGVSMIIGDVGRP